jgi:Tol biopolymer transport system component
MLRVVRRFALTVACGGIVFAFGSPAQAAFPGQNGRIVFTTAREGVDEEQLFDMRPNGADLRNLTNNRAVAAFMASYSPDGRRIVFGGGPVDGTNAQAELYVMNADGLPQRRLTFNSRPDYDAAWSPDGERLVFARRPGTAPEGEDFGPPDLWTLNLRTGEERQLTNSPETEESRPQWSPDGERIVFHSDLADPGGDNFDIYTIRPNGRDLRQLTSAPSFEAWPNYSPDGKRITFTRDRKGNDDVFVMRADGSRKTQLTHNRARDFLSVFSPDGRFIAWTSEREGDPFPDEPGGFPDIFRMRADGSQQTNLTRSPGDFNFDPDWQPLPGG